MKEIISATFLVILSATSTLAQPQTIVDYRNYSAYSNSESSPRLSFATENFVISKVVKSTDKPCYGSLEPKVIDYAHGSFTAPKTKQVAYLVDLGDSCHPRGSGTKRIAISSGKNVASYGNVTDYYDIKRTTDINGDGVNEIVLEGSWLGQGYLSVSAKLVAIKSKGMLTLKDFEQVYSNNLGTMESDKLHQVASVISADVNLQGQIVFKQDNYIAKCLGVEQAEPQCKSYQYMSTDKFPEDDEVIQFIYNRF